MRFEYKISKLLNLAIYLVNFLLIAKYWIEYRPWPQGPYLAV